MNSKGPSIEPCGTFVIMGFILEDAPPMSTKTSPTITTTELSGFYLFSL